MKRFALGFAALALIGCSGDAAAPGDELGSASMALINCGTHLLGPASIENSCGLGWVGPFGNEDGTGTERKPIAASHAVSFPGAQPAFASTQVVYTVKLPGSRNHNQGAVKFAPTLTQDYSIVTDEKVGIVVQDSLGSAIAAIVSQDIGAECKAVGDALRGDPAGTRMRQVKVYPLVAGNTYTIVFQAAPFGDFNLTIDEPNDFFNAYYRDGDGDGFGDSRGAPFITECTAPVTHVAEGADCNDGNANVFPGAPEAPGTGDNNCDTVPDGDPVASDLSMVDVAVLDPPKQLVMGHSTNVFVRYRYVNRGPALMNAVVTTDAHGGPGVNATPGAPKTLLLPNLTPVLTEELIRKYKVKCRHHGHDKVASFSATIAPADSTKTDSDHGNDAAKTFFEFECVDCHPRHHGHHDHHHKQHTHLPPVCRHHP